MDLKKIQLPGICVALVATVLAVFGQVIHFDFINVDDNLYVYQNPHVASGLTWNGFLWAFTQAHAANWHPLTWLSHMLDCQVHGLNPGGHHLTNVILHAANAVLLFLVLRRMTGDLWPCTVVATLFAIHPLRVESVAWVAERKDVLSGFFFMLTLWCYARYAEAPSWKRYGLVALCFVAGLMAKPMLVTLPFVLLLLDYWPLRRLPAVPSRKLVAEKIPLLVLATASALLALWAQAQMNTFVTVSKLPLTGRLTNAAVSFVVYLGQLFFPHQLAACYPHPFAGRPALTIAGAVAAIALITVTALLARRRFAYLPVGWFWYLGMLVPVIGLIQVGEQAHADRYTYLPQIGLYLALAWGLADVARRWPQTRPMLTAGAIVGLLVLGFCAWRQTSYWRNAEVLWQRTLAGTPPNWAVETFLGDYLSDRGRVDEAIVHYQRARELSPDTAAVRFNLGYALYHKSALPEAQQELEAALRLNPELTDARVGLGVVLYAQGKIEPAVQQYQQALSRNPTNSAALSNLGVALEGLGRMEEAISLYRRALEIQPARADIQRNLDRALNNLPAGKQP